MEMAAPSTCEEWRELVLQFIGSLTLCNHMGDVSNDVNVVLERIDEKIEWDEWWELGRALGDRGITTLQGTSLADDEDDEEKEDIDADD